MGVSKSFENENHPHLNVTYNKVRGHLGQGQRSFWSRSIYHSTYWYVGSQCEVLSNIQVFEFHKESRATLACLYRTSGRFFMLQFISVDSRHFTQSELSLGWSDLYKIKSVFSTIIRQLKGSWAFVGWMCPTFLLLLYYWFCSIPCSDPHKHKCKEAPLFSNDIDLFSLLCGGDCMLLVWWPDKQ